jgi:hypothetical protein
VRASEHGHTNFTRDEQITVMTLWSICRSPLMFGGNLPDNDDFTLELITNDEVLAVNQHSSGGNQLYRKDDLIAWLADVPDAPREKYLAVFNARNEKPEEVLVDLKGIGFDGRCQARDLWKRSDLGTFTGSFAPRILPHGAGLYRLSPG